MRSALTWHHRGRLIVFAGMASSILTASFVVLSSTSSPARAASSLTFTTGLLMAAVWNAVQHGTTEWHGGLQPMTFMLEQNLLQMAAAHDPSWLAMCDGFVRSTYDDWVAPVDCQADVVGWPG